MKPEQLKQAVEEYKQIYLEEYGVMLTDELATKKANALLSLFNCLTQTRKEVLE